MFPVFSQKSNRWREFYNPLRGLSLQRLVSLLEAGERGQYADLQWMYHFMERSDAMIHAVIQRRKAALLTCDWDIRQVPEVDGGRWRVEEGNGRRPPLPRRGTCLGPGTGRVSSGSIRRD